MRGNITMPKLIEKIKQEIKFENNLVSDIPTVSLTFDDGYESFHRIIHPILSENGIRGTFFIIGDPGRMGGEYLTEKQVKDLSDWGHEIGDHAVSHTRNPEPETLRDEWLESKPYLESITGKPVLTHCYPYGHTSPEIDFLASGVFEATRGLDSARGTQYNTTAYTVDRRSPYNIKGIIDDIINSGSKYATLVMHQVYDDDDAEEAESKGRQTRSQFKEWVDYLGQKKGEGLIQTVPYYEGMRIVRKKATELYIRG